MKNCLKLVLLLVTVAVSGARGSSIPDDWNIDAILPRDPKIDSSEVPSAAGPMKETRLTVTNGQIMYAIVRLEFPMMVPPDQIDVLIQDTKQAMLRNGRGTLKREEKIKIADQEGRRYVVDYTHEYDRDDYRADYRFFLIDRVLYTIEYEAPINTYSTDQARDFFHSVRKKLK